MSIIARVIAESDYKPKRKKNLTPEQKQKIAHMREEVGLSCLQIAMKLDVSEGSVFWYCLIEGIERKGRDPKKYKVRPPETLNCMRNGFMVRAYTKEDDKLLLELEATGMRHSTIGRTMNPPRRPNSIKARLAILARHQARAEEEKA